MVCEAGSVWRFDVFFGSLQRHGGQLGVGHVFLHGMKLSRDVCPARHTTNRSSMCTSERSLNMIAMIPFLSYLVSSFCAKVRWRVRDRREIYSMIQCICQAHGLWVYSVLHRVSSLKKKIKMAWYVRRLLKEQPSLSSTCTILTRSWHRTASNDHFVQRMLVRHIVTPKMVSDVQEKLLEHLIGLYIHVLFSTSPL